MNSASYDQDDGPTTATAATSLTAASRRIREATHARTEKDVISTIRDETGTAAPTTASSSTKTPEYIPLHELAKGWKAAISWASDPNTKQEARVKNDRGNLPLHSAASFRAPVEVIGECSCF
jgi:hypothetical protein